MNINMKKTMIKIALFIFTASAFSCASFSKTADNENFNNILDRDWNLAEVKKGDNTITIDRANAPKNIYTIKFENSRLCGVGEPNRYKALYTEGENHTLSIGRIASTRMASLYEMENFAEYEYFECLQNVNCWHLRNGNLELCTSTKNDARITLIFF